MSRFVLSLMLVICMGTSGCLTKTIRTEDRRAQSASHDGNVQDSGLISIDDSGALITSHARNRFNSLVLEYGNDTAFNPPLKVDDGITEAGKELSATYKRGPLYYMTHQSVVNFVKLNRWRRNGKAASIK